METTNIVPFTTKKVDRTPANDNHVCCGRPWTCPYRLPCVGSMSVLQEM